MPSLETTLVEYFDDIEDVRLDRNKKHLLVDILVLAICGVICGANGPTEIVSVAKGKRAWFQTFLALPNGIPSHDTIGRVLARIRPDVLGYKRHFRIFQHNRLLLMGKYRDVQQMRPMTCQHCA